MPTYHVAAPINKLEIEKLTLKFRELLGCCNIKYLPVPQIVEFALPRFFGDDYTFRVAAQNEMGSNHGFAEPDSKELVLREDIYEGMIKGVGRDRMTAMHECAHLLLHPNKRLFRSMQDEPPKPWNDPEWQAKCFGGMVMMPTRLLAGYTAAQQVAKDFGVSVEAAAHRLKQLRG